MTDRIAVGTVESAKGGLAREFVQFPFTLYRGSKTWVPAFRRDVRALLDRRHPFFERAQAQFFVACKTSAGGGSKTAGTIAAFDNMPLNERHGTRIGHFHFFECIDDPDVSHALFDAAFSWLRGRGLREVRGPFGIGMMGTGILVDGFEHRAAMTMMPYNHAYYVRLVEAEGFAKYKDQFSAFIDASAFVLPEKIRRVAEIALKRGHFTVPDIRTKRELKGWAPEIGRVYNESFEWFGENFVPLTDTEIQGIVKELVLVADPSLIKLLLYKGEVAGFLFGFPDLSEALQRSGGRLNPLTLARIMREYGRTKWLIVNGAAILPRFQRLGGNALLYYMLEKISTQKRFLYAEAVQIAETTVLMLSDLATLGARIYKTHRIYRREI